MQYALAGSALHCRGVAYQTADCGSDPWPASDRVRIRAIGGGGAQRAKAMRSRTGTPSGLTVPGIWTEYAHADGLCRRAYASLDVRMLAR